MRCPNCEFENREGVNFCEECGEKLEKPVPGLCPACGFQNREGVNFCEECGEKLQETEPAKAKKATEKPKPKPSKAKPQPAPRPTPEPIAEPIMQTPPQTVVVQVQQGKKRRLNPLWLALLLLLLVISCACMLMYDVVVPPDAIAAAVDPVLETVRESIPPAIDDIISGIAENINGGRAGTAEKANQGAKEKQQNEKGAENIDAEGGLAGCDFRQVETCTIMGGTVKQNPFNYEFEEFCVCEGMEYDQAWCEGEGGWWNEAFEMCSFENACYDLNPDQFETAMDRGWFGGQCNNYAENKNGDIIQYCSCPNLENLPDSCEEIDESVHTISNINCVEGDVTCAVSFSQKNGFPADEIRPKGSQNPPAVGDESRWTGIIKLDNGKTINLHDCGRNTFSTEIECSGFDFDGNFESASGGIVYLCRGYCCVFAGEEDRTDIAPVRLLTSQCPAEEDLSIKNFRYEKGVILFDVINGSGWQNEEIDGKLIDGLDRDWSDVSCEQAKDNQNLISCRGAGTVRTGRASIAFEPDAFGEGCNTGIEVLFPLPEYTFCPAGQSLCAGSCCSEGHCCTCNGVPGCWESCSGCD